jgi:hypothetical protein
MVVFVSGSARSSVRATGLSTGSACWSVFVCERETGPATACMPSQRSAGRTYTAARACGGDGGAGGSDDTCVSVDSWGGPRESVIDVVTVMAMAEIAVVLKTRTRLSSPRSGGGRCGFRDGVGDGRGCGCGYHAREEQARYHR